MRTMRATAGDGWIGLALGLGLFVAYNANGREIASYDSQPNKYAARELLLRGTMALNHVVGATPELMDRPALVVDREGRYRSAYSPVSPILAAAITWPLWKSGVLDLRAARAPSVIAALGASVITAIAVVLAYFTARQRLGRARAVVLACGLGLGTGLWAAVSQTLWVHETAILGFAIAMLAFAAPVPRLGLTATLVTAAGLALAGVARPQLAPAIALVLAGLGARAGHRDAMLAWILVGAAAAGLAILNVHWFGDPFGPVALMRATNNAVHRTSSSFTLSPDGFIGLLVSPNRGLLVFSPIVAVAFAGIHSAVVEGWKTPLRWCALAALAQWGLYGTYSVWWAGHTYGPRYLLDVLPLVVPLAAATLAAMRPGVIVRSIGAVALAWSIVVAATGAFCYPHDEWNTDPNDIDRDHSRLWSWSDMQIVRCWERGLSPQNFNLFERSAWRSDGKH